MRMFGLKWIGVFAHLVGEKNSSVSLLRCLFGVDGIYEVFWILCVKEFVHKMFHLNV